MKTYIKPSIEITELICEVALLGMSGEERGTTMSDRQYEISSDEIDASFAFGKEREYGDLW